MLAVGAARREAAVPNVQCALLGADQLEDSLTEKDTAIETYEYLR